MKLRGLLVVCFALALQGCVSASKHEKLQSDYDKAAAALSNAQKVIAADDILIRNDTSKLHDLDLVIKDLETKLGKTSSAKLKLESNVAEMQAALEAMKKQRADAEKGIQDYRDFVSKFKSLTDTGKISVKIVDGQMVVVMSSDVLFPSGSAKLSKDGVSAVQQVSSLLAAVPDRKYQVEGFTDNIPIKTAQFPSNWELASARALTVVRTMLESGIPPERTSAASFGETHPVKPNDTPEGRTANRRIEIVVVADLSTLPGYDELQKMASP